MSFIVICFLNIIANNFKNKLHLFIDYISLALYQGIIIKNFHSKKLIAIALFSTIFFVNFFETDLIALETAKPMVKIDTLDQLIDHKNIEIIVVNRSRTRRMLLDYHPPFEKRLAIVK